MSDSIKRILSHDCGAFWQFVKYGVIGVLSTIVQTAAFYVLASTALMCLNSDDLAVRLLSLPYVEISDSVRAWRFGLATGIGFVISNIFCWVMNRVLVFKPGRHVWYVELAMFMAVSGFAMLLATVLSGFLISRFGLMTTLAVLIEVFVSFIFNFLIRKFIIFKG